MKKIIKKTINKKIHKIQGVSVKNTNSNTNNNIIIYGKHPFFSILKHSKRKIYDIFVSLKNKNEFLDEIKNTEIDLDINKVKFLNSFEMDKIFNNKEKNHQGYLMFVAEKQKLTIDDYINSLQNLNNKNEILPRLLILDQILDPHNLGAIIRTAVAFGVYKIIITNRNSVKDTPIVSKSSAGLNEVVDLIEVVNLNNTIKDLKNNGYFVIGLDGEASMTLNKIKDSSNLALVLGNEGRGIRELVKKNCDDLVKIEMGEYAESLNVSVASAIVIYELWR